MKIKIITTSQPNNLADVRFNAVREDFVVVAGGRLQLMDDNVTITFTNDWHSNETAYAILVNYRLHFALTNYPGCIFQAFTKDNEQLIKIHKEAGWKEETVTRLTFEN